MKYFLTFESKFFVINPVVDYRYKLFARNFNVDRPVLLLIGASENKNLPRVLDAVVDLKMHLCIVANIDFQLFPQLLSISHEIFTNLSIHEIINKYENSDIVCVCSTDEGFGLPIVEAQVVGRPVVTSIISCMPEVAGDSALFVNPFSVKDIRDGIERIIDYSHLREKIIENGYLNSKIFSHIHMSEQYLSLYRSL